MITCFVRYTLDTSKLEAFEEYARIWLDLIPKLGGTHHGYFLPSRDERARGHGRFSFKGLGSEGPSDVAIALFSFPSWEVYERYRAEAGRHEACQRATRVVEEPRCFTSYERSFMEEVSPKGGST